MSLKALGFAEIQLIGGDIIALGYFAGRMVLNYLLWKDDEQESTGSQSTQIEESPLPALRSLRRDTH